MNYLKIYNDIVQRAKSRKINGYKERHHIIPKCMNGTNDKDNIIELTAKEHFISHMLLCKIYPNENKLKYALWRMIKGNNKQNRYNLSSKTYDMVKKELSMANSNVFSGENNGMYGKSIKDIWIKKYGIDEANKRWDETNKKRSINGKKPHKKFSADYCKTMNKDKKGKPLSEEHKRKIKESCKGIKKPRGKQK